MKTSTSKLNQTIERLTSGYKINHAQDNAANYSISTNMTTKIGAYEVAENNTIMGIDMLTTASDTLSLMQDKGERLRALAIQVKNGTYGAKSIDAINAESKAIIAEIQRLYSTAEFNGIKLFNNGNRDINNKNSLSSDMVVFTPRAVNTYTEYPIANINYDGFIENPYTYTAEQVAGMKDIDEFSTGASGEFKISSADDLAKLATLTNSGADTSNATFVLERDIDLSEWQNQHGQWIAIGSYAKQFKGVFDGNGHCIKNYKINASGQHDQGFFGYTSVGSIVKNVAILEGSVTASNYVGLLVGHLEGELFNSFATGYANGRDVCGGLVGGAENSVTSCYMLGDVDGRHHVGGLIGQANGAVTNCYARGDVTAIAGNIGGLVGRSSSDITNCYATGNVTGGVYENAGGLAGQVINGEINNCYATGDVNGLSNIGGLAGYTSGNIQSCYATGNVAGQSNAGGLAGIATNSIENCKSTGIVTANNNLGSLIGTHSDITKIKNCTTIEQSIGTVNGVNCDGIKFLTNIKTFDVQLQVGINSDEYSNICFDTKFNLDLSDLFFGINTNNSLKIIDNYISLISSKQTEFGAITNRLESALDEISTQYENLVSSRSTLRDADMADLSSTYIQHQILQKAAATLMATANQNPAIALQLI